MIDMLLKWNKNALVIALVMMSQIVLSQTIDRAEYFIDSDPGVTNGQAITITTSSDLNENLTVDVSGLTVGNHVLYVRTRQDDGLWSISKAIPFFVQDTIQDVSINEQRVLVAAEYFIDEDPGVGKGTALPLNVLLSVDIDFSFSSAGLSIGEHTVYVRLRDNTGVWSLAKHLKFAVLPSDQNFPIPLFESDTVSAGSVTTFTNLSDSVDTNTTYKWDVFDDGSVDFTTQDISFAFDSSGPFDVRLTAFNGQDSSSYLGNVLVGDFENISVTTSGSNSLCEGDEVMLTAPSGYTAYVWNTRDSTQAITVNDAGTYYALLTDANGTTIKSKSVVVTVSQAFTASVEVIDETTGQGNGFAHVVIDGADANSAEFTYAWSTGSTKSYINGIATGSYSVTITRGSCSQNIPVTVGTKSVTTGEAIATDIMSAEYFFDSDPGAGNGTSLNISTGSEVDFATEIDISSLEVGNHNLYLRTLGNNGLWSLSKQMPFYVQDTDQDVPISGSFNIVSAEYFVDEDPGIGSGTAVNVTNPTQVLFQNLSVDVSGLTDGAHKLYVRTQSETGMWSIAGQMDFQKCTSLPATLTTTDVVACPGENLTLSVSGTESTYAWYKSDTTLIDGQSSSSYNLGAVTEDMTFYVSQISSGGCQSQLAEINVTAPKLDIYAGLDLTISNAGEGFQLEEFFPVEGTWDVDNSNASVTTTGLVSRGDFTAGIYDFRYSVDSMGCVFTDLRSVEIVDLQQQLAATIDEESAVGTVIETIDIPNIVSYSIASGDDAAIAIDSEGEITVANSASFDFETSTTEIFTIWAKESETLTHDVILTVTLIDQPDPPIFSSGTTASMEENTTSVVYTATTDDSNAVYSLGTSKDESAFTLSGNEISFTNAPDFESPTDANADNVYLIDVIATSTEGKAATIEVAITVTDIDESGPEFTSEATTTVEENTTDVAYTITTDDPTATFDLGNTKDESVFSLSGSDIRFVNAPDFENPLDADFNNTYIIDINATDASGFSATLEVSITVTDVDESGPVFTSGNTASVQENSTDVVYTAETDDPVATYALGSSKDESLFTLSGNTINFTNAPDFESPQDENGDNVYLLDVIATNSAGFSTTLEVSITVTDVDESGPVFTSGNTASVQENSTDVVYTAETDDPVATYALGSSKDESLFTLSGNTINFTNAPDFESPQDENGDNVYLIDVIASNATGASNTLEVSITVTDVDESGPVFTSGNTASVQENSTDVVYTAETDDPAATYALGSSKDESLFTLSGNTINFTNAPDFESPQDENGDNVYLIDVIASNATGASNTLEVSITVTDVDESGPVFTSENTASVQENNTDVVYTAETDDPEVTYALGSSKDESLFTLSGNTINFTNAPDFESPQDENGDNVYLIDVIASNATGASNTLEVSITVTDVDESGPVFTSENTASVQENNTDVVYTAETDDPEVTYALGSSKDESLFTLSGNAINFTSAPDFENPQDENGDNVYLIDVIATDLSGNASTLEVAISVTDLDDQTVLGSERLATLYNYPNPVKNSFSLKGEAIQNGDVLIILSLDGKEMYQLDATTDTSHDVSNLQSGVYLIRLQRMGKTIAESRLIKK